MVPEKPESSLVKRYYTWEKLTITTAIILIITQLFGFDNTISIPLLNVKFQDPHKLLWGLIVALIFTTTFTIIEWKQSSNTSRKDLFSKFRFAGTLLIAFISLWINIPSLTEGSIYSDISRYWYAFFLITGYGIGTLLYILVFSTLMILPKNESKISCLPRIPIAAKSQFKICGPLLFALIFGYFTAIYFAPPIIITISMLLTGLPIVFISLKLFIFLNLSTDNEGRHVSYRDKISQLREIFYRHTYKYFLIREAGIQGISQNDLFLKKRPQKVQDEIKKNIENSLVYETIKRKMECFPKFGIKIIAKDGDSNNQNAENLGAQIKPLNDHNTKVLNVKFLPKDTDSSEENVLELNIEFDILEKHASEFLQKNATKGFEENDLFQYILAKGIEEKMLNKGIKGALKESDQFNPLFMVAASGREDILKEYTDSIELVNKNNEFGWTPLLMATANKRIKMIKLLLKSGANPDTCNLIGITPLMYAARYGNLESVKLLLNYGAEINLQDSWGQTALAVAVKFGNYSVVALLLKEGANKEIKNHEKETPLDLAYKYGYGELAKIIRKTGSTKS